MTNEFRPKLSPEVEREVELHKKINAKMEASVKRIMDKYGGIPTDEFFSKFMADVYIAGAADALETLNGKDSHKGGEPNAEEEK